MQRLQLPQQEVLRPLTELKWSFLYLDASLYLLLYKLVGFRLHDLSHLVTKDTPSESKLLPKNNVEKVKQEYCQEDIEQKFGDPDYEMLFLLVGVSYDVGFSS